MQNIPVVIVGAGPVGLSMALALSRQNIRSLVLECHAGLTQHPRARGVNVRTMELFKQWGNDVELRQYEQPPEARRFIWAESFQGKEITRVVMDTATTQNFSPAEASLVSQDRVEESLYHALLKSDKTKVQFLRELKSFKEDETSVLLEVLNKETNQIEILHTQYLIAADGAHSQIREQLGIAMEGHANLGQFCSIYCEMDITAWTQHRPCIGFFFTRLDLSPCFLASVDGKKRWIVGIRFAEGNTKEIFTDEYCISEIRRITEVPDLCVNLINKNFWTMAAQVATEYRQGRIFLVGDAAHRLPPTGGFGMNTGIQDAHNLAWKLAYVLNYGAPDSLLDTYYTERAPIAKQNIAWSTDNAKRYTEIYTAIHTGNTELLKVKLHEQQGNLNYSGLDLGFIYHSPLIESENQQTISGTPSHYIPTTLPGSRAPHFELIYNNKKISTIDLFEKQFILLIGPKGEKWEHAVRDVSKRCPFPIQVHRISVDNELTDFKHDEISDTGAILVRPDGHVALRRATDSAGDPRLILENYFKHFFDPASQLGENTI